MSTEDDTSVRLDKWLWAARFFKTRGASKEAIEGGRIHLNGSRAKPARQVRAGDTLDITRGEVRFEVVVAGVSEKRGPAVRAQELYEETEQSQERRRLERERRKAVVLPVHTQKGRPTKRDRRQLQRLKDS